MDNVERRGGAWWAAVWLGVSGGLGGWLLLLFRICVYAIKFDANADNAVAVEFDIVAAVGNTLAVEVDVGVHVCARACACTYVQQEPQQQHKDTTNIPNLNTHPSTTTQHMRTLKCTMSLRARQHKQQQQPLKLVTTNKHMPNTHKHKITNRPTHQPIPTKRHSHALKLNICRRVVVAVLGRCSSVLSCWMCWMCFQTITVATSRGIPSRLRG